METWKTVNIKGLEKYEASDFGNFRISKNKKNLTINNINNGYSKVSFAGKSYPVHRIVALTYLPNLENKSTVNHIDKNKHNNRLDNLEWATHSEQKYHSVNKIVNSYRPINQIDIKTDEIINKFNSLKDAGTFIENENVSKNLKDAFKNISVCATKKSKSAYGYKWEYVNENSVIDSEIWQSIFFDGKSYQNYFVSNIGRIKNKNRILKQSIDNNGYYNCASKLVHILVAKAFIANINNYDIVNHKDGNKLNNNINNLEWTTIKMNAQHAVINGLRKNVKKVCHIDNDGNIVNIYNSCADASLNLKVNTTSVNKCCKGQLKTCGEQKYKFRYLENDANSNDDPEKIVIKKNKKQKKISIFSTDNEFIETLDTITKVVKKYNVNNKTVISHCDGIVKYPNKNVYFRYHT